MSQHPFGVLLRRRRHHADLTIEHLAERSGLSARAIGDIERGVSTGPQRRTVIALADALELAGDDRADFLRAARPGRRGAPAETPSVSVRPFRLPDFAARDAEMEVLAELLREGAATTPVLLSGTAGVGKTTVALEALHRASTDARGILFANVHSPDTLPLSPLQVLQALLRQTEAREEADTLDDAVAAWRRATASASLFVLLDNIASEEQVRPVLTALHPVRLVLTSRRPLAGLEGCRRVVLGPLDRPESIDLLSRIIAPAQRADGDLDELAALCADLPLALRIAGSRISSRPGWTVADFTRRLGAEATRLRQLVAGDLSAVSAFALSYDALTPRSQRLFRGLSLITGPSFRADMTAAVDALSTEAAAESLDELVDSALLEPLIGERYRMHDLLRVYAKDKLASSETEGQIEERQAGLRHWILETARRMALVDEEQDAAAGPSDASLASAREWLQTEADAWLGALESAAATPGVPRAAVLAAADALVRFSERWLAFPHWRTVARIAVAAAEQLGDRRVLATQLELQTSLELGLLDGDADHALELARRTRDTSVEAGAVGPAVWALVTLSWAQARRGELAAARETATQALAEATSHDLVEAQVQSRYFLATGWMEDDPKRALHEADEIRRLLDEREADLSIREWSSANNAQTAIAAKALLQLERYDEAVVVAEQIMDDAALFPHEPAFLARAHRHRGFALLGLGETEEARRDLQRALDLVQPHERPDWWAAEIQTALDSLSQP
ncbi:helix-turn-helix domain-containing protein [Microbacterium sp. 1P10UB]|uniref:helix-turn-helix domain-containing protein n=1 Tax=unclassified Microbacterium TaxID=2609290 RepID=UPI0039A22571